MEQFRVVWTQQSQGLAGFKLQEWSSGLLALLCPARKKALPWAKMAACDLEWLASLQPGLGGLGPPGVQWRSWQTSISCHTELWKELVRQSQCFESSLPAAGVVVCDLTAVGADVPPGFRCPLCPSEACRILDTPRALSVHMHRCHGHVRQARKHVIGTCCPACGTDFHVRERAVHHLQHSSRQCKQMMLDGTLQVYSDRAIQAAEEQAKTVRASADYRRLCKMKCRPPQRP